MAAVGVLSGLARSLVQGDPALAILLMSVAAFCYGGIIAIPAYAFVAALLTLSTKTTWGQRAGEIFAAIISAGIWLAFVIATLGRWPPVCVLLSSVIIAIMSWLVRLGWTPPEGPSPESSLRRLLNAKHNCDHKARTPFNDTPP